MDRRLRYLTDSARTLLMGCRVPADDGNLLYTPDGKGNYKALWTRDFAYMVENAGDLIPPHEVEACIRFLLRGQCPDGVIPDRVRPDGVAVYAAGGEGNPVGEYNLDNGQFLVIAVDEHLKRLDSSGARTRFREWSAQLDRGMDSIPRCRNGLVENDPQKPHSPYGFTDTVGKTGELFMESLLYWTACKRLANRYRGIGSEAKAQEFADQAKQIEMSVSILFDSKEGAFLAATRDCRQIDIWGNAFALSIGFPLGSRRESVLTFLIANLDKYEWRGQVRHLRKGEYWQRLLIPIEREEYQNGAYWATASGWLMDAVAMKDRKLALRVFDDLVADFRNEGICECVNRGYRKLDSYVVSATNPLAAARRLFGKS